MVQVTYVSADGAESTIDAPAGMSVMQAAVLNGIDGIIGECGGSAMCATCHVHIDAGFAASVPPRSDLEDEMLESAAAPADARSRLGCQIALSEEMSGLVVHLPSTQT